MEGTVLAGENAPRHGRTRTETVTADGERTDGYAAGKTDIVRRATPAADFAYET